MSSLFLLCREPLPQRADGWRMEVGPVRVEPEPAGSPLRVELTEVTEVRPKMVLRFDCPSFSAALLAEGVAEVLGRASRGVLVDEATLAVLEDYQLERPLSPEALDAELLEVVLQVERGQAREANDWSFVSLAD